MKNNRKCKVCMLTSVHKPFDDRIFYKQAVTLRNNDYNVCLIAPHDKNETVDKVRIIGIRPPEGRFERFTRMQLLLLREAIKENADVYHFHDPELILIGLILKIYRKKVIYDVHELVFKQIGEKNWIQFIAIRKCAQFVYRFFERLAIIYFDCIILAEDGYLNYFYKGNISSRSYSIVRNSPILSLIDEAKPHPIDKKVPIVIYAGSLSRERGIREIIESMHYVNGRAELYLLGEWESREFMSECVQLRGWERTKYLGYRPLKEVYGFMKRADIGISVLYPIENYLTSLPVKVFEYMACSLPMIISDFPAWRKVFNECAIFVDPLDSHDIADKIIYILENYDSIGKIVSKGTELVINEYNWDIESRKLTSIYEEVCNAIWT